MRYQIQSEVGDLISPYENQAVRNISDISPLSPHPTPLPTYRLFVPIHRHLSLTDVDGVNGGLGGGHDAARSLAQLWLNVQGRQSPIHTSQYRTGPDRHPKDLKLPTKTAACHQLREICKVTLAVAATILRDCQISNCIHTVGQHKSTSETGHDKTFVQFKYQPEHCISMAWSQKVGNCKGTKREHFAMPLLQVPQHVLLVNLLG